MVYCFLVIKRVNVHGCDGWRRWSYAYPALDDVDLGGFLDGIDGYDV